MVGFELKVWGVRPPLARDKLREAQYFLEQLRRARDVQPAFRYFFSATVSAARSVTLILQSDLRPRAPSEFDQWWAERRNHLSVGTWTFKALVEARNLAQKEGNIYPAPVYVLDFDDGPVERVEYVWVGPGADYAITQEALDAINDEMLNRGLILSHIKFRVNHPQVAPILAGGVTAEGKTQPEAANRLIALARQFVRSSRRHPKLDAYAIGGDQWFRTSSEIISDLSAYLAALDELLEEADRLFLNKPSPEAPA